MPTKSGLGASPHVPTAHCDSAITAPCTLVYLLLTGCLFVCRPHQIHTPTLAIPVSLVLSTVFDRWLVHGEYFLMKERREEGRAEGRKERKRMNIHPTFQLSALREPLGALAPSRVMNFSRDVHIYDLTCLSISPWMSE